MSRSHVDWSLLQYSFRILLFIVANHVRTEVVQEADLVRGPGACDDFEPIALRELDDEAK